MCACLLSCFKIVLLFVTLWAVAHQAPLSMGFSKQEYQSGLPCPFRGDLPEGSKLHLLPLLLWEALVNVEQATIILMPTNM